MKVEEKYKWFDIPSVDPEEFIELKNQYHHAIQHVGAVGRMYLGETPDDANAALNWVPGLWRLAGKWISGNETFRCSISFRDFTMYIVNEKVKTLASLDLSGKSQNQILVWLEQHIISLNLSSSHFKMILPYQLPSFRTSKKGETFSEVNINLCEILGGHYHNAFFTFSKLKEKYEKTSEITIHPRNMDATMKIILRETGEEATNTFLRVGYNPGDEFYPEPYFFVRTWPNVPESKLMPLKTRAIWHVDDWVGAVYVVRNLWDSQDQESVVNYFFDEAVPELRALLLS